VTKLTHEQLNLQQHEVLTACQLQNGVKQRMCFYC